MRRYRHRSTIGDIMSDEMSALSAGAGLTGAARVTLAPEALMRRVDDEVVLLNLQTEQYYFLDDVGARMLELVLSGETLDSTTEQLLAEFEVARERLQQDLRAIISDLKAAGLVSVGT